MKPLQGLLKLLGILMSIIAMTSIIILVYLNPDRTLSNWLILFLKDWPGWIILMSFGLFVYVIAGNN